MNGIIAAAFNWTDTEAPTAPGKPTEGAKCQTTLTLSWTAATDNVAVTGYKIYDDGIQEVDVGDVLTYNLTGLTAGSTSTWTIKAYDAEGNLSDASSGTSIKQGVTVNSITMPTIPSATANQACADSLDATRYITGANNIPNNGDTIYTDSCGTTVLSDGSGDFYSDGSDSFTVSSVGVVGSVTECVEA